MDGIPKLIWRDFPHPNGPNLGGREHVPFTDFEIILARQILSCGLDMCRSENVDYRVHCRQDVLLAWNVDDEYFSEEQRHPTKLSCGYGRENIVGTSSHKTLEMNDAFVDLLVDDDASTNTSESDVVQVKNPSFFSHRATVEELIASFRKNTIGPLAGVEIRDDPAADPRAIPVIVISDEVSQRSLDCALEKWRVEQEEKQLERRWRATKRLSENWLTKVELVREKHRARREKFEREREKRKAKAAAGTAASLAGKGSATLQGDSRAVISNPQPHSSVLEPHPHPTVPPHPGLTPSRLQAAALATHSLSASQATNDPAFSHGSSYPSLPSSSSAALPTHVNTNPCSSTRPAPQEHASPIGPNFPHAAYDPRTPDLALEELAHISPDSGKPNQSLPESTTDTLVPDLSNFFVTEAMQCVQQYIDMAEMLQSPSSPYNASRSQDSTPPSFLPLSIDSLLPEPEGSSGDISAHFSPQESQESHSHTLHHSLLNHKTFPLSSLSLNPTPMTPDITSAEATLPSEPTAEEKMWHVWSLSQAPPGTAADVILRNPHTSHQSNLAPILFNLFPKFKGNKNEDARLKILSSSSTFHEGRHPCPVPHETPQADTNAQWTWTSISSGTFPLDNTGLSSMLAPRAVLIHLTSQLPSFPNSQSAGKHTVSQDQSTAYVPPSASASRPTPVLKTQDLAPSLSPLLSHVDSPMSPTSAQTETAPLAVESSERSNSPSALYPQYMPMGSRLFRIAKVGDTDVLRTSYWFEPDIMATERMRNVVNLMEQSAGWRRPERRTRVFDGDRKARGPDDLASFGFGY